MRKFLLILTLVTLSAISTYAQIEITRPIEELGIGKNTVVTNDKGVKYKYTTWSKLIADGGYKLTPLHHDSDQTSFILIKRDDEAEAMKFAKMPKPEETKFFKNGTSFLFTDLKDINGVVIKKEDLTNKIVVLNFWFIACPPCRYEMPELNRLVTQYKNNKDVIFIAINLDKKAEVERFLKVSPFSYHVIPESLPLFSFYGVNECPASLVVDKTGIIRFNSQGYGTGSVPYWIKHTIEACSL